MSPHKNVLVLAFLAIYEAEMLTPSHIKSEASQSTCCTMYKLLFRLIIGVVWFHNKRNVCEVLAA